MDAHGFSWLVDHVGLLVNSSSWNADDQADIEAWFSRYLDWLSESEFGVEAREEKIVTAYAAMFRLLLSHFSAVRTRSRSRRLSARRRVSSSS